ncbi:hypothetical protein P3W45_001631 [Vairimorpha bombi]|jgi:hypothetical protein
MAHHKLEINQYVVFKYLDEWHEGRIIDYKQSDTRLSYRVYSYKLFTILPVYIYDHILPSTTESVKKISRNIDNLDILRNLLSDIISYDKMMTKTNMYYRPFEYTIQRILDMFSTHLIANKIYLTKEEIYLSIEGLKNIISDDNMAVCQKEKDIKDVFNTYGVVQGVRVCYIIMKYLLKNEDDYEVKQTIYGVCVYFLDFIICNYKTFYDKNYYI